MEVVRSPRGTSSSLPATGRLLRREESGRRRRQQAPETDLQLAVVATRIQPVETRALRGVTAVWWRAAAPGLTCATAAAESLPISRGVVAGPGGAAAGATGSSCPRSFSQPECRSSAAAAAALSWVSPPPQRRSRPLTSMEPPGEAQVPQLVPDPCAHAGAEEEEAAAAAAAPAQAAPGTEDNNHPETDSSSCRTSNSSATLSSCMSMEPCACPEECMFTALSHADATFRKMEGYLRSRQLCDVILVAGDRRIPAHRLVLSSVSDYFAAMFTSDVREAKQDEVKMEGVDPDALWVLVQYAYTACLPL
ncbi:Kelch-like protein 5 [Larimichthys crocea]|uniref:Uncharacterized protein n=1 Tax=Larimichthys crocea TaxID=215358 RepID=A0ACD3RVF4_LARCR|nr:Kelch-like protein 5 [Larimichthys crocea]